METQALLERHYSVYQIFVQNKAVPKGHSSALRELASLRLKTTGKKTNLYCAACIAEMLNVLYKEYDPGLLKEQRLHLTAAAQNPFP